MNNIVLGLIIAAGVGVGSAIVGYIYKRVKNHLSDDIDPTQKNNWNEFIFKIISL